MRLNNKSGFTLLEIIIVLIIIGVLASLALPRLFSTVEYSRATEALDNLKTIRQSVDRCYLQSADYGLCIAFGQLDIDDPNNVTGRFFQYTIASNGPAVGFTITAQRTATQYSGPGGPPAAGNNHIYMTYTAATQQAVKSGDGVFANIR